jgi:hypothetical protein
MLSKCANPACSRPFRYLRDGKLFEIDSRDEVNRSAAGERETVRKVEFFWLCGDCSAQLTIINDKHRGIITVPIVAPPSFLRRAAAS